MGMDVYGKKPASPKGEYFRNNVWYWHPLWDFCLDNFEIANKVKNGHTNSGDGLGARDAKTIAKGIKTMIANGDAQRYIDDRETKLSELERVVCFLCNGTGIRTDELGTQDGQPTKELRPEQVIVYGRTHGWCNGCDGEGNQEPWELNYHLTLDNLEEFAEFLEDCGGFEIC